MQNLIWIGAFGLLGIFSRYGIDQWLAETNANFPLSTFLINILGSALAGIIFVLGERQEISPAVQMGLLVGFCGGFTTFSAFSLQTFNLLDQGRWMIGMSYLLLSPVLGLLAAVAAVFFGRKLI